MFRRHASVDGDFRRRLVERIVAGQRVQLVAGQRLAALFDDAQVGGDASRGERMVAGDHDGTDAGPMRFGDGGTHFGARRIDDADHAHPDQFGLQHVALFRDIGDMACGVDRYAGHVGKRCRTERAIGLSQRTIGFAGKAFDRRQNLLTITFREWTDGTVDGDPVAIVKQHIRRTFRKDRQSAGIRIILRNYRHALSFGSERDLADATVVRISPVGLHLACTDDQGNFRGIADGFPYAGFCVFPQVAVIGQRTDTQCRHRFHLDCGTFRRSLVHYHHAAFRRIARAGNLHFTAGRDHAFHGLLVAGERSGLVGADHRCGAKCFHGM